jgi:hypothetical protein
MKVNLERQGGVVKTMFILMVAKSIYLQILRIQINDYV